MKPILAFLATLLVAAFASAGTWGTPTLSPGNATSYAWTTVDDSATPHLDASKCGALGYQFYEDVAGTASGGAGTLYSCPDSRSTLGNCVAIASLSGELGASITQARPGWLAVDVTAASTGAATSRLDLWCSPTASSGGSGSGSAVPGVTGSTATLASLEWLASGAMIRPAAGQTQLWFSSEPENANRTVTASTADTVTIGAGIGTADTHVGRKVYCRTGTCKGEIREITANSGTVITVKPPWSKPPGCAAGCATVSTTADTVEIFTGELIPGTHPAACTRNDPCLDRKKMNEVIQTQQPWVWLDSGDVWDTATEYCNNTPAGRCTNYDGRINADQGSGSKMPTTQFRDQIIFAISGTDETGKNKPVIDCDAASLYPTGSGGAGSSGLFETSFTQGTQCPNADCGWFLLQNLATRCWARPATPAEVAANAGRLNTIGVSIFRLENGNMIVNHTEHGEIYDAGWVISSGSLTAGHKPSTIVAVDVQASLGNLENYNSACTANDAPFNTCSAANIASDTPSSGPMIANMTSGNLVFVGSNWVYTDHETTVDASGTFNRTMFNIDELTNVAPLTSMFFNTMIAKSSDPQTGGGGWYFSTNNATGIVNSYLINSACKNFADSGDTVGQPTCVKRFAHAGRVNTDYLNFTFANVQVADGWDSPLNVAEPGGAVTGRCMVFDEIKSSLFWSPEGGALVDEALRSYNITRSLWDTDDEATFDWAMACGNFTSRTAMQTAIDSGACVADGGGGNWQFFPDFATGSPTLSAELGGEGTDGDAFAAAASPILGDTIQMGRINAHISLATPQPYTNGLGECTVTQAYTLPAALPQGVLGPDAISTIVVTGRRNYGMN